MNEWMGIEGWPSYEISNLGSVRRKRNKRLLKVQIGTGGYCYVSLRGTKHRRMARLHVIVAATYLGPRPEGKHVNHKDGDKKNNNLENLEYVTPSENMRHAVTVTGLLSGDGHWMRRFPERVRKGQDHNQAKLTEDQVRQIFSLVSNGAKNRDVAAQYGISYGTVGDIRTGKAWRHLKLLPFEPAEAA